MPSFMWTPAQSKSFYRVPDELHLGRNVASRRARMLRPIPYHYTAICAHCRNDVGVLWLIPSRVDFALVIDLLHDV